MTTRKLAPGALCLIMLGLCGWGVVTEAQTGRLKTARSKAAGAADPAALAAERGEWSRWRGPNGDGISLETGLLNAWPAEGPPLAWRTKGLGNGFSSVAVAGGKIYTLGEQGGKVWLFARNALDGGEVWKTPVGGDAANSTPTVDGDLVFGLTTGGDLFCCRSEDGTPVWSNNFGRDFGVDGRPGWGFSESPLVDGDVVVCTPGNNESLLAALDKQTGKVIWTTKVTDAQLAGGGGHGGAGYSSVVISHAGGVKQYVTLIGRGVVGVDAATGKLLWFYPDVANGTASIPTPIVAGDHVFCSSGYGAGSALIKLNRKGEVFDVQEVYFLPGNKMQNHHGGMIHKDGFIYCGEGHNEGFPLCIDGRTGKDAWRQGRGPGSGSAAVAYADGHLYFRYQDGTMALIEATPRQYRLKGKFKIASQNGESWPHPVIAGGKLYLRDQDELLCYDVRK
jgi:outer membrane protein assembly factor BamB